MRKLFGKVYPLYVFIDLIFIFLSFSVAYVFRYNKVKDVFFGVKLSDFQEYTFTFALWALFIVVSFRRRDLYSTDRNLSIPKEFLKTITAISSASILIGAVIFFTKYQFFSRNIFIASFIYLCVLLSGWRIVKRLILRRLILGGFHNVNVLIIGAGRIGRAILEEINKTPWLGLRAAGFLDDKVAETVDGKPVLGRIKDFFVVAKKYFIDEVIITIPSEKGVVSNLIKQIKKMRLGLGIVPSDFEESLSILNISNLGVVPLLMYKERKRHPAEFAMKRLFDFFMAMILLGVLSPLFIIIAVLIKIDSQGSVFYTQKRMGFKGEIFKFYKFRSMICDADKAKTELLLKNEVKDGVIFKIRKDPRITKVGRFLRKYSLDELPQIFNVLKGDMSLIGPRPFPVDESKKFEHNHMPRLSIRPGITGLAQVKGRSHLSFNQWVKWDLWYINKWSFGLDLRILLWTIPVVLKGKGAY